MADAGSEYAYGDELVSAERSEGKTGQARVAVALLESCGVASVACRAIAIGSFR